MRKTARKISTRTAALLLFVAILGTALALTITPFQIEKINLFGTQIQDTDFSLQEYNTKVKGKNRVDITLTIKNEDTAPHFANVTVQLLDTAGDVILEQTAATGEVLGGDSWTHTFVFQQTGLVEAYDSSLVIIDQSS